VCGAAIAVAACSPRIKEANREGALKEAAFVREQARQLAVRMTGSRVRDLFRPLNPDRVRRRECDIRPAHHQCWFWEYDLYLEGGSHEMLEITFRESLGELYVVTWRYRRPLRGMPVPRIGGTGPASSR
jgi:hypothetical protein